jgi:2,5-diamino-6-(ribosylamino)-4(3H)-pyrimidinone 5'-phosphate reductase
LPELPSGPPLRRLYPPPAQDSVVENGIYGDLELPPPDSRLRPYVLINMVASVDGRSSVAGKASGIGGEADRRAMRALRSRVDAVMVGAGTLRAEKLNLGLDDPEARQPLAVILAGSGPMPLAVRLAGAPQNTLLITPEDTPDLPTNTSPKEMSVQTRARTETLRAPNSGPGRVDLRALLKTLRSDHGVERLLVEGGPSLNRALIDEDLADEIFLTIAPKLLSGDESAIVRGDSPAHEPRNLELLSVHSAGDELFLRYRLKHGL